MMKISSFARKSVSQSKHIILMIALASALICAVVNLGFSVQQSLIDNLLESTGDSHVKYNFVTEEQTALLSSRREVALSDLHLRMNGWGNSINGEDGIILSYSSALGQMAGFKLTSGRPPRQEQEAAIPPHVAEYLGIDPKIGAEFDLSFQAQGPDGSLTEKTTLHFVVSGILQEQRMYAAMDIYDIFVSLPLTEKFDHRAELFLRFKGKYEPRSTASRLAELADIPKQDISLNEKYLSANFHDFSIILFTAAVLLILCAAGALVIYNAYNLSIEKKIHQYGLLLLIGASKKQIQSCVRTEALYCTLLGLPFGLLAGTLTGYFGTGTIDAIAGLPITYTLSPAAYLLSAAVTLVMVLIGVMRPSRKASQIAPVDAVRFTGAKDKQGHRPTVETITLDTLAHINLSRKRSRTIGTVLSLTFSGILFIGVSTIAFSLRDSIDSLVSKRVVGDIVISNDTFKTVQYEDGTILINDPLSHDLVDTIRGLDGVTEVDTVMLNAYYRSEEDRMSGDTAVAGVEEHTMEKILSHIKDGHVTMEDFNDPHNVIAVIRNSSDYDKSPLLAAFAAGKEITLTYRDMLHPDSDDKAMTFRIVGVADAGDVNYAGFWGSLPMLYTLQDSFKAFGWNENYRRAILTIDEEMHDDLYPVIKTLCLQEPELSLKSQKALSDELKRQITGVTLLVLLIVAVVALIGFLNLASATYMGIEQRKKELGVLMAIGLSRKSINKLLTHEGILVSLICSVLSTVLGLGLGFGLYRLLVKIGVYYLQFTFPFWPLVLLCCVMGLVPYAITLLASHRLQRSTIVELLGRQM